MFQGANPNAPMREDRHVGVCTPTYGNKKAGVSAGFFITNPCAWP
jgi:hypothetical protein